MNLDMVTQLHDSAVQLMKIGYHGAAMRMLRDALLLMKTHEAEIVVDNDTAVPSRISVVHMFPVSSEGSTKLRSMCNFPLFRPWEVFCETNDTESPLSYQETMLFIVTILYNIGICYQTLCLKHVRSLYQVRAKNVYEIALRTLPILHAYPEFSCAANLLGASTANNLGAIFADTFQIESLTRCVDLMEHYAQDIDITWTLIHFNIFEWRAFETRHAALA